MIQRSLLVALLSLGLAPFLAGSTQAQELSATYTKRFHGGSLSLSLGNGPRGQRVSRAYGRRPLRSTGYSGKRHVYRRVWIPGRYEVVHRRVWVPGFSERIWVEPVYDVTCDAYGNQVSVLVRAGHYRTVRHPGRFEVRREKVWRPGAWSRR